MSETAFVAVENICRYFRRGTSEVRALDGVSLSIPRQSFLAIVGPSGCGKSTLLNILGGLDTPTAGIVSVEGNSIHSWSRKGLALYRARQVGMVFQAFNLIPHYTALQNVETALLFNDTPRRERRLRATAVLEQLGLSDRTSHRPADLSGGEQQRVAIARAIVKSPDILLADEPTGNLDLGNARQIGVLLAELNKRGITIVMVTHNLELAHLCGAQIVRMHYGRLAESDGSPHEEKLN